MVEFVKYDSEDEDDETEGTWTEVKSGLNDSDTINNDPKTKHRNRQGGSINAFEHNEKDELAMITRNTLDISNRARAASAQFNAGDLLQILS